MTETQTNSGDMNESGADVNGKLSDTATVASVNATQSPQAAMIRERISAARRYRWKWNGKLLLITGVTTLVVFGSAFASYYYHSGKTAATFLGLAQAAEQDQDYEEQAKWLRRYALLVPDDVDVSYQMAIAADKAADEADRDSRGRRIDAARRSLSRAIGQIGSKDPEKVTELRERLIHRLVQLGGPWNREAERQVEELDAAENDSQSMKWLAAALVGEVSDGSYSVRDPEAVAKVGNPWGWLANQSPTYVLGSALTKNPRNLDLITHFLFTRPERPEVFQGPRGGAALSARELAAMEVRAVETLREMPSSHAKLVLHRYLQTKGETDQAARVIQDASKSARQRLLALSQNDGSSDSDGEASTFSADEQESELVSANPMPIAYWDFVALYDAARLDQEEDPESALETMQFLTTLSVPSVPNQVLESLYFEYGRLLVSLDRPDEALAVWKAGIEKVGQTSILLPRVIASVYASQKNWDAATEATQLLADSIDTSEKQLSRMSDADMSRSARIVQGRKLAAERWQLNVLNSYLAAARGDEIRAIGLLRKATDADADIPPKERGDALMHLAGYYSNQGVWDAAATTLEKAVSLDPENTLLRQLTAEAWNLAGNQNNSLRQLDLIDSKSSLLGTIAELETRLSYQLSLPPEQQNLVQIRDAASQLTQQLEERLKGDEVLTDQEQAVLRSSLHYIEVFTLAIPPAGVAADQHLHDATVARQIDEIAKKYPDEANLQAFAAERLAQADQESEAMAALDRLTKLGATAGVSEPSVRARVWSALGRNIEAAKLLIDSAHAKHQPNDDAKVPSPNVSLLQDASVFASRGGDTELAYQALTAIPTDKRTLQTRSAITQLARSLPADSESLSVDGKPVSPDELYKHWLSELRKYEGENGTYWRYLRANDLLAELRQKTQPLDPEEPKLVEASKLVGVILTLRPRWGEAIALQGRISVATGDKENAVVQLRRAIDAGSNNFQTWQLLVQQLIALNRGDEAERAAEMAERSASGQTDRLSASLINSAIVRGDYSKSMQLAKEFASKHPKDVNAQLVVAATGTTALANLMEAARSDELKQQVRDAISDAIKLAGANDPRVISAELRLAIALDDDQQLDDLIQQIESAKLSESDKSKLLSQAYVAKEDYEQALEFLLQADQLDPSSRSQLQLAEVYRRLDRPQQEISALRLGLQRDPSNAKLRNLLAEKLVALGADGQGVDWQGVGDLLDGDGGGTPLNQFMHGILLGTSAVRELNDLRQDGESDGQKDRKPARLRLDQAQMILRGLVRQENGDWKPPARYLATLLQQEQVVLTEDLSEPELAKIDTDVRELYQRLIDNSPVAAVDVYQYALYLLNQSESDDDATIESLSIKLNSLAKRSLQALDLSTRVARRQGKVDQTPGIVDDWAEDALNNLGLGTAESTNNQKLQILLSAGQSLQNLGFAEDALQWFERAYREYPLQTLASYIVALAQTKKLDEAVDVCAKHYAEHHDAQSATLLVEVLLNYLDSKEQAKQIKAHDDALVDASERFNENAGFLEGLGTLKMAEGQYDEAVKCFVSALKVTPKSVRSLNNLAMSFAEIPSRASEGIAPINSALQLSGQNPELLDTKGVVLMASGRIAEAEATFAEAFAASNEPRHLFHLILAQIKQKKDGEAARNWKELDMEKLDPMGLTANERVTLKELKSKYTTSS